MRPDVTNGDAPPRGTVTFRALAVAGLLALAVLAVYAPVRDHAFVEFDDPLYVTENAQVQLGLTGSSTIWAFTNRDAFLFHPLSWLSYMLDVELWGAERAGPFALTNAAIHALTAALLLCLLHTLTGRLWPSAFVAAVFALHPLRVESVAWVSERKDVLSGLFFVLTLWAYAAYTRRGGAARYAVTAGMLLAGLLAKPLLVSVPILLLLLDAWPLARLCRVGFGRLVLEKLPLLGLGLAVALAAVWMMAPAANVWGADPPLPSRLAKAGIAYVFYLGKTIWPTNLSIVYPDPTQQGLPPWGVGPVVAALAVLGLITGLALACVRRAPAILVGWLWYIVALAPVAGIVPFGLRVMHDRHTYIPAIGLALAVAFGVSDLLPRARPVRRVLATLGAGAVAACAAVSWLQVDVWRDSRTLFDHALAVTERNALVHFARGIARAKGGDSDGAEEDLRAALAIHPGHADAHSSLGWLLEQEGHREDAIRHYRLAAQLRPGYTQAQVNLANALAAEGEADAALALLREAVEEAPRHANARYWLGNALGRAGRWQEAEREYRAAVDVDPGHSWSHAQLASLLEQRGKPGEALSHYRAVLAVRADDRDALRGVAWILATTDDPDLRDGEGAVTLAQQLDALTGSASPPARYTLAAAYAATGRFEDAVAVLEQMLARLTPADVHWEVELRRCADLYRQALPFRPPPPRARG